MDCIICGERDWVCFCDMFSSNVLPSLPFDNFTQGRVYHEKGADSTFAGVENEPPRKGGLTAGVERWFSRFAGRPNGRTIV